MPHPRPPKLTPVSTSAAHLGALRCSFCERSDLEVKHLWAGAHAYVCNDCIRFLSELIVAEKRQNEMLDPTDDA